MVEGRGWLPEEVAIIPAGPALATAIAGVDRARLSDEDLVRLAQARQRLVAHVEAQLLADLHAIGGRVDRVVCRDEVDRYEWAETEIAFALTWTRNRAGAQVVFADQLCVRLPAVFHALDTGEIDVPKAMVFCDETAALDGEVARRVCDQLLGQAARLTTGQLRVRLRKLVLAADPDAVRKNATAQVKGRRVEARLTLDGLAELAGVDLPPHRVAAAMERLTALARAAKSAGDGRKIDQLRADAFLDLLVGDGVATGGPITETTIGTPHPTAAPTAEPEAAPGPSEPDPADPAPNPEPEPASNAEPEPEPAPNTEPEVEPEPARKVEPEPAPDAGPGPADGKPATDPDPGPAAEPEPAAGRGPSAEARPVDDDAVRPYDGVEPDDDVDPDDGVDPDHEELAPLWAAGFDQLPTSRPEAGCPTCGAPAQSGAMPAPRKGVVDIQVPLTTLIGLTDVPGELAGWGPVIAEIARQVIADQPDATWRCSVYDEQGRLIHHGTVKRRPKAQDAAFVRARDKTCRAPGCRRPARQCDIDHTQDLADGGSTCRCNLACLCRMHHLLKHLEHSGLIQLDHGVLAFRTPLGQHLTTHPEAYLDELKLALLDTS